jgi:tRNA C32,U32 (ribose-2'-O)-methylase TrmJ
MNTMTISSHDFDVLNLSHLSQVLLHLLNQRSSLMTQPQCSMHPHKHEQRMKEQLSMNIKAAEVSCTLF